MRGESITELNSFVPTGSVGRCAAMERPCDAARLLLLLADCAEALLCWLAAGTGVVSSEDVFWLACGRLRVGD